MTHPAESTPIVFHRRCPLPAYPTGWYCVGTSDALPPGAVQSLRYFGRDLVLYRDLSGRPALADAHCPHLGAHLGCGGKVTEAGVVCPFHGWSFGADGVCTQIPGARRIPPGARLRTWTLREQDGVLLTWFDPTGAPPTWEIEPLARAEGFAGFRLAGQWKIRAHVQDTNENCEDTSHFLALHGQHTVENRSVRLEDLSPKMVHVTETRLRASGPSTVHYVHHGLGLLTSRVELGARARVVREAHVHFYSTPIDDESMHFTVLVGLTSPLGTRAASWLLPMLAKGAAATVVQDIPVWENKVYRSRPVLSSADGPIGRYRRWARQFYPGTDAAAAHEDTADVLAEVQDAG